VPNKSNRIVDIIQLSSEFLASKGIAAHRLEAEMLLGNLLGLTRLQVYLNYDRPLSENEMEALRVLLRRRSIGEPLQYILGYTEFYGIRLKTEPGVFLPRPETELIIDVIKNRTKTSDFKSAIDIGCGGGALALAVLNETLIQSITAVDISEKATRLIRENAETLGFISGPTSDRPLQTTLKRMTDEADDRQRTQFLHLECVDFLAPSALINRRPVDLIISNPPYIEESAWTTLPREIRDHEPKQALVSGSDGLGFHRAMAIFLPRILNRNGLFLGEIGEKQGARAIDIHRQWSNSVRIHQDLAGRDRVVEAEF